MGRGAEGKTLILIAVEHIENKPGRIRLLIIPDTTGETMISPINSLVSPRSVIETDGYRGYSRLSESSYMHVVVKSDQEDEPLPQVHLVISLLKRWILGTHQGGVQSSHLGYYLEEFTSCFTVHEISSRIFISSSTTLFPAEPG